VEELLTAHPAVREAAVVGIPDEQFGQRLRAFVVLREGRRLSEDALRQHVRANLARYEVPRDVVFLDALPRTPTGKVLRRVLAEHGAGIR
jgi:fatty-acyl-CoA synthase